MRGRLVTWSVGLSFVWLAVGCGGSGGGRTPTPTAPTPTPAPIPPQPPIPVGTMSGTIVDQSTGGPIAGARIEIDTGAATVLTTDAAGRWEYSQTGGTPLSVPLAISAPGYVSRRAYVRWQLGSRTDIAIDLIRESAPFSMQFYREFVRNLFAKPEGPPEPLRRWTTNPNFFINTANPKAGGEITPAELDRLVLLIRDAVGPLSGGRLQAGVIESGRGAGASRNGYIEVSFYHEPDGDTCGTAAVGADPGRMRINYGSPRICGSRCGNFPWRVVVHELGHALGFWHVKDGWVLNTEWFDSACDRVALSPAEQYHARIAYSRPPGNLDPDNDPQFGAFLQTAAPTVTLRCR